MGASDRAMRPGNALINNLIRFTYPPTIYPVNPKGGSILGLKTYKIISRIPGEIDPVVSLLGIEDNFNLTRKKRWFS